MVKVMAQYIFTFVSPLEISETITTIKTVVESIGGKIKKEQNNVIHAQWRSKKYSTMLPVKCTFYVGHDMVRAIIDKTVQPTNGNNMPIIKSERKLQTWERVWDEFVEGLNKYTDVDFGLKSGTAIIDSAQIISDGIEQVFTSTSQNSPSYGGALLGGALFGDTGAIIGSMNSRTTTRGNTTYRFSNKVLARVRYTNGLVLEGELKKKSSTYNEIMVNMSVYNK